MVAGPNAFIGFFYSLPNVKSSLLLIIQLMAGAATTRQRTEIKYLSGTGKDDTDNWDF